MNHKSISKGLAQARGMLLIIAVLLSALGNVTPAQADNAGTALQYNGTNQYVTFGSSTGTTTGLGVQAFTIELWFKRTGTGVSTSTGTSGLSAAIPLVAKGRGENENSNVDMNYFFGIDNATNRLAADFEECASGMGAPCVAGGTAGLNHPAYGATAIVNNVWYHAAVTYDGRYWKFFLNGVQDGVTTDVGAIRYPRWDSIQHAGIGTAMTSTGAAAGYFAGITDEVRIWNVVRSEAEIQASMNSELTSGTGLIGRWGLNEGSGTAAANSIAGRPNGTLTNTPTWVTGFPLPDLTPPAAPTGLSAAPLNQSAMLTWTANAEPDLSGYNLYRSGTAGGPYTKVNVALITGTAYTDTGLTNGIPYYYVLKAVDAFDNESAASAEVNATPAPLAMGLQFDGTNDYVNFGTASGLGAQTFTVETWFKRTGTGASISTGTNGVTLIPLVAKGAPQADGTNVDENYVLGIRASDGVLAGDFEIYAACNGRAAGDNNPIAGVTPIVNDTWYHAAFTYDGAALKLYLNGNLEATLVSSCPPRYDNIQPAALGTTLTTAPTAQGFFAGAMDETRIWNVARTQLEIQADINNELTSGTGLIARWGMNEGAGGTIASSVGTFPGTLTNGPTWVTGSPFNAVINPVTQPAAPSLLIAAPTSSAAIYLSWQDNSNNEETFKVERSTDGGTNFSPAGMVAANITAYEDSGLTASTQYCYRVYAENGGGASDYSNTVCATTTTTSGSALDFGSGTAYVTFGDPAALDLSQFTIETWFKRTGTGTISTTGNGGIPNALPLVAHGAPQAEGSNVDANWVLVIDDTADVIAADFEDSATGANHPVYGVTPITNNVWHHAAATYDGATWRLYLDGNLEATLAVNMSPRSDTIQHAALGTMIESDGISLNGHFQGVLDESRVWNYARSQAEIQAAINDEILASSGLVARWGLNEGAGTNVGDSSGNAVTGTITDTGYAWVSGAPFDIHNAAPNAPTLVGPANGATGVSANPTLTVNVTDPESDEMTVSFYGRVKNAAPGPDFTIIAIPDPQYYASTYPSIYNAQMNWVVNNQVSNNIAYVVSLGDNVDTYTNLTQWTNATNAWDILAAGGIDYALGSGNHDGAPALTENLTTYFGARKTAQSTYGGRYGTTDYDNYYTLFDASGMEFIVVVIELDDTMTTTSHPVLVWANNLLQTYSNRRAIVVTHNLINGGTSTTFSTQGSAVYEALKGNPNLFMMLGGHLDVARHRTDTFNSNTVYSLRSDYQMVDSQQSGYLRIMRFSPADNMIYISTYSPTQDKLYPSDTAWNQFSLPYTMNSSGPYTLIGTTTAASGANASVTWNGLAEGTEYEWYAVADDGDKSTDSAAWGFTTEVAAPTCYTLTLSHTGQGADPTAAPSNSTGCPAGQYVAGENISLSGAVPTTGWQIASWTGTNNNASTANTNTLTMPASAHAASVNYTQIEYTLTVDIVGSGSVTKSPNQTTYHFGDVVALTATPTTGWSFGSWSGNVVGGNVTINGNTTVTATFTQNEYTLTVDIVGSGSVTKSPNQTTYHHGDVVALTATPTTGWSFGSWSGNVVGGNVTINGNTTVTATFTQDEYTLTINKVGNGTVTKSPDQLTYQYGDVVALTATPDADWYFGGWSGNVVGGNVTITGNTIVIATFSQNTYTLDITIDGNGTVTKSPDQASYHYGDVVALTATPDSGWVFFGWSANVVGGNVTINGNTTVTATFKQNQATLTITAPASVTFGDADATIATSGGSGTGAVTFSAGASTACSIVDGKLHVLAGTGTCQITATKAGDVNYVDTTSAPFTVTINKANASCTVTGYTGTFDGSAHGASGSCTGLGGATLSGLDLGASYTDVPGGAANWTFIDASGNYNNASGSVNVVINAKEVTVTADNQIIAVGEPDPTFTFTADGFVAPDDFLTAPTCEVVAPHASAGSYDITCSGGDAGSNYTITYVNGALTVTAVNNPPTDIALSNSSVNENQPVGTTVGALSTADPDVSDTHTYTFCGGADDASFQINGSDLQTNAAFDFETRNAYSVCVRTDDGNGGTFDETLPISISNLAEGGTATFKSFGPLDGWTLESGENTNRGGTINFGRVSFRLGDVTSRKQYRSILSFDTSSLPDNAIITKVTLRLMKEKVVGGGDPVSAFQGFVIDIRKGVFGTSALQTLDFQAPANKTLGPFVVTPTASWYSFDITSAKAYVNKLVTTGGGLTQVRLRFQLDDDNNSLNNYLTIYSGNAGPLRRPQLIVEYTLP